MLAHRHGGEGNAFRGAGIGLGMVTLERWVRARTTPQRLALRSRIVLMPADGLSAREVARRLRISRHTVDLWRGRYANGGCHALTHDRPGSGRKKNAEDSGN